MKAFIFVLLIVVFVSQTTSVFSQLRYRRDAQQHVKLSPDGETKRTELMEYVVEKMITLAKYTVDTHKKLFENVLKNADEADLKSENLKEQLKKFTELVDKATNLPVKPESEDDILKLFELFGDCADLLDKYDDVKNPTEEEKLIERLLKENGAPKLMSDFLMEFVRLRSNYELHIQTYVDTLSNEDKTEDGKFLEWFQKFKDAKGFDQYFDITMEIFNFLDDEDSNEKTDEINMN